MKNKKQYWLMKSEGDCYSIDDLKRDVKTSWEGVRNYQARNFMMSMNVGDGVLFYHSNGTKENPSGIYGLAKVAAKAHVDVLPWFCVDVAFVKKFKNPISLFELKLDPRLDGMIVTKRGDRLSVQPVSEKHFLYITSLK